MWQATALCSLLGIVLFSWSSHAQNLPLIVTTWPFGTNATMRAWELYFEEGVSMLEAVERGISETCETSFCSLSVGPFGKTDETGDLSLDAMMMDGATYQVGAVGGLRRVKEAIRVARAVMKYTKSTFLTGDEATQFAVDMGFTEQDLRTAETNQTWQDWKNNNCQPNFRANVSPDPLTSCGPYVPNPTVAKFDDETDKYGNHDTVCQILVNDMEGVVVGTSTNGLSYKIPGRVGDTPIPGAGAYAANNVGAAVATGNGDIILRFLPSAYAVEAMRSGKSPQQAAAEIVNRIKAFHPDFAGAVLAANVRGEHGAACYGYTEWNYIARTPSMSNVTMLTVNCEASLQLSSRSTATMSSTICTIVAAFATVLRFYL